MKLQIGFVFLVFFRVCDNLMTIKKGSKWTLLVRNSQTTQVRCIRTGGSRIKDTHPILDSMYQTKLYPKLIMDFVFVLFGVPAWLLM